MLHSQPTWNLSLFERLADVIELTDIRRQRLLDFTQKWEQNEPSTLGKVVTASLTIVGSFIVGCNVYWHSQPCFWIK